MKKKKKKWITHIAPAVCFGLIYRRCYPTCDAVHQQCVPVSLMALCLCVCPTLCVCLWFTVSWTAAEASLWLLPSWTAHSAPRPHWPERWGVWFVATSQTKLQHVLLVIEREKKRKCDHASQKTLNISPICDQEIIFWPQWMTAWAVKRQIANWGMNWLNFFYPNINSDFCRKKEDQSKTRALVFHQI